MFLTGACQPAKVEKEPLPENIIAAFSRVATTKNYDSAFHFADRQLQLLRSEPDSLTAFITYSYALYDTANRIKNPEKAKAWLQNIIDIQEKALLKSPGLVTKAYYYWAETHYQKISSNYNDTALRYFEKAIFLNSSQNFLDTSSTRFANRTVGIYYNILGDLKKSMLYYDRERSLINSRSSGRSILGNATNRSIAFREMGRTDESIQALQEGLAYKNLPADKTANALTELSASQLEKGLIADAKKSITTALNILDTITISKETRNEIWKRRGASLYQKGRIHWIEKDYQSAAASIQQAIIAYQQEKTRSREIGKACIEMGNIFIQLDMQDSALMYFHKALINVIPSLPADVTSLPSSIYTENTIMEALDAKAGVLQKIYETNKNPGLLMQAINCYELAFETEYKLLQGFSYDESLTHQSRESKKRSEKAITACYNLYSRTGMEEWANKAFSLAEKSKSIVLQESIKRNIAANSALQLDSNWIRVRHYQQEVNYYEKLTVNDTASLKDNLRKLSVAENNLLLANTSLLHSNSVYRDALTKSDSLSLPQLQKKLPGHTALIEYFAGDSANYIFVITKNSPAVFIRAGTSLTGSINNFIYFFTDKNRINNDPAAYQAAAFKLYHAAGFPAIQTNEIEKLILIPDGKLNLIPFEALVTVIKPGQNPQSFSYLLLQKEISYGYSAGTLFKQADHSPATSDRLICFAPVFANKERGNTPLLQTIREADAIKKETSAGEFYMQEKATIGQFKNSIASAGIIHIASHANADTSGGLRPVIEFYDSSLYLDEIYTMHINPRLVVLSACETGIGVIDKSEGAMSLARGFYYAGAQNIITSLWSVDDKSTAEIFTDFYSRTGGNDYTTALCDAKRVYLSNASVSLASPYYWAGFIHIGYQKQSGKNNRSAWIISFLAIAILSIIILRKRK